VVWEVIVLFCKLFLECKESIEIKSNSTVLCQLLHLDQTVSLYINMIYVAPEV
jgi:hypothetical protein